MNMKIWKSSIRRKNFFNSEEAINSSQTGCMSLCLKQNTHKNVESLTITGNQMAAVSACILENVYA